MDIWEMTEGCICCSMKSDFASSILTIANTLDPEYLVVEPTGVGILSNVITNIRQIEYERISILSPITIVDENCFAHYMQTYPDILEDQIKAAGKIVISKHHFSSLEETDAFAKHLHKINPDACVYTDHYTTFDAQWWEELLTTNLDGTHLTPCTSETLDLENFGLGKIALPGPNHLIWFLEHLVRGEYGNICRAKGVVRTGNETESMRFDVVDTRYSITGFSGQESPKAIFIGKHLARNKLRKLLLPGFSIRRGPKLESADS